MVSEVAMDAELKVGDEVEVGADSPFVQPRRWAEWSISLRQCLYEIMWSWILFLLLVKSPDPLCLHVSERLVSMPHPLLHPFLAD